MTCKTCILYDAFVELLEYIQGRNIDIDKISDKLPKCNCDHHEPKAARHHEYSDVAYFWNCPIHGRRTEKVLQEMMEGTEGYGN